MDGFCQDERHLYLVLEYISGGELFTYLRNIGKLDSPHAAFYAS
jgi:serine/threonine protein kinase